MSGAAHDIMLLDRAGVAAALGHKVTWFYNHQTALEAQGFPRPIIGTGTGGGARWDPRAIRLWLDRQIPAGLAAEPELAAGDMAALAEQAELDRRSATLANRLAQRRP